MKFFNKQRLLAAFLCAFLLVPSSSLNVQAANTPAKVQNLKCGVTTKNSINISWTRQSGISGYQVYRSESYDGSYKRVMNINPNTQAFCNMNLPAGKEFYYKVRSFVRRNSSVRYGKFSGRLYTHTKLPQPQNAAVRSNVNMRRHAGTNHPVMITLRSGSKVSVLCRTKDKRGTSWTRVQCKINNRTYRGYIRSDLLSASSNNSRKRTGTVTASSLNVRSSATTASRVVGHLSKGQRVTILKNAPNSRGELWYYISYTQNRKTIRGYVHSRYLKV